jgi:hypothetical protein
MPRAPGVTFTVKDSDGNIVRGSSGNISLSLPDLAPGTYTCTIVIDP